MLITVDRFKSNADATLSRISVDGAFVCFGLEDEFREKKVMKETRIPAGRYKVGLRKEGGKNADYKKRYPAMHRGMLHLQNVPGFEFILIHVGNTEEDTEGCLLVGLDKVEGAELKVGRSRAAYETLYPMVVGAAETGQLEIEVQDNDR